MFVYRLTARFAHLNVMHRLCASLHYFNEPLQLCVDGNVTVLAQLIVPLLSTTSSSHSTTYGSVWQEFVDKHRETLINLFAAETSTVDIKQLLEFMKFIGTKKVENRGRKATEYADPIIDRMTQLSSWMAHYRYADFRLEIPGLYSD